ncbi:hypothetical protein NDU88_007601 [Pleurodeles waltl]|uniref:Uncharacterized protein n=1 Tax=Pleurodeles waltl TaxID=8319 RepID=A0AAV7WJ49_PLEWA|nr:hypothetical protein NDU88_007601 [Pleurodeles waltl]
MCEQSVFCFTVPQRHFRLGPEAEWQRAGLEAEGEALLRGHCLRLPVLDGRHVCAVRLLFHSPTGSLPPGTGSGVAASRAGSRGRSPAARTLPSSVSQSHSVTSAWDRKRSGSEQGWKQWEKPCCADTVCVCQCLMAAMCEQSVFSFTVRLQFHSRLLFHSPSSVSQSHSVTSAWDRKRSGSEQGWKQREQLCCADTVCVCQCLMAAMCEQSVFCFTVPQRHFRLGPEAEWQRAGLEAEGEALLRGHCLRLPMLDGRHVCAVRLLFHSPPVSLPPGTGSGVAASRAGSSGRSPAARTLLAFANA